MDRALLDPSEGEPFQVDRADGHSPIILVCEHASCTIPASLSKLGVKPDTLTSHAAWDIGALATAQKLSALLDAPLIHQRFSRLVYDCNRPPEARDAIPEMSEVHAIPGNRNLSDQARNQRVAEIYEPFRDALADLIATRTGPSRQPVIVTIHSYTRVYFGVTRHQAFGLLHDRDRRLADVMLELAEEQGISNAMRNYPYGPEDGVTHTLRLHAVQNGLLNVMIEFCSDLIDTEQGQNEWAAHTARLLEAALERFHIDAHAAGQEQA